MGTLDYNYLMKLDNWSKKEAALIICGLDPDQYRHIRFSYNHIDFEKYPELVEIFKLYKIFLSIDFHQHREYQSSPIAYVVECKKRDWPVPDELFNLTRERYAKEKELYDSEDNNNPDHIGDGQKEKDFLLKTLGILIMFHASKQNSSRLGNVKNVNVSQVVNDVLQFLDDHEIKFYGLGKSALNRRFSESIRAVVQSL